MRTNLEIDDKLLEQAMKLSKLKTKKEIVQKELVEYVRYLAQQDLLELKGKVEFWPGYAEEISRR